MLLHGKPPRIRGWVSARARGHMRPQPRYARLVTHTLSLHLGAGEGVPATVSVSMTGASVRADEKKGEVVVLCGAGERVVFTVKKERQWKTWVEGLRVAGAVVGDFYEVGVGRGVIGRGAFSEVFEGRMREGGESVAVKIMDKVECGKVEREHATCEARVLSFASHPGVVRCLDIFDGAAELVVVMENMAGGTLEESLGRIRRVRGDWEERGRGGGMPMVFKVIVGRLLGALAYMHENGVVHRDVKPDNILVGQSKSDEAWASTTVVSDFGLAAYIEGGEELSSVVGTPEFLAPEILRRDEEGARLGYGPQVDVWAAGVVLYWLLTGGETPFVGAEEDCARTATGSTEVMTDGEGEGAGIRETSVVSDMQGVVVVPAAATAAGSTSSNDGDDQGVDPTLVCRRIRSVPDTPQPLDSPAFHTIGEDAKSLLRGLLNPQPSRRLSAMGALAHPIFAGLDLAMPTGADPTIRSSSTTSSAADDPRRPVSMDTDESPPPTARSRSSSRATTNSTSSKGTGPAAAAAAAAARIAPNALPTPIPARVSARFRAVLTVVVAATRLSELLRPRGRRRRVTFGAQAVNSRASARRRPRPPPIEQAPVGVDGIRYNVGLLPMPRPVPARPRGGSSDSGDARKARETAQLAAEAAARQEGQRRLDAEETAAKSAAAASAAAVASAAAASASASGRSANGESGRQRRRLVSKRQPFGLGRPGSGNGRLMRTLSTNGGS